MRRPVSRVVPSRGHGRLTPTPIAALLAVLLLATACASRLILDPAEARQWLERKPIDPTRDGHAYETVTVQDAGDRPLRGWLFRSPGDEGVVLVGGGASTAMPHSYDYYRFLVGRGFGVLFLSYQGFDGNPGPARLESLRGDWLAFARYAESRYPGEPLVFLGLSVGGTAGMCAAAESAPAGLVVDGVMDLERLPYAEVLGRWWLYPVLPLALLAAAAVSADVPDALDARACAARATAPVLFVHHPRDRLGPFGHAVDIFLRYAGPKELFVSAVETHRHFHVILAEDPKAQARTLAFLAARLGAVQSDDP